MTDNGISKDALLAGLHEIDLPSHAPGGVMAETLIFTGLALAAGLVVGALFRLISLRPARTSAPHLQDKVRALAHLPDAERRTALLHLVKDMRPDQYAALKQALYRRDTSISIADLEAELDAHV